MGAACAAANRVQPYSHDDSSPSKPAPSLTTPHGSSSSTNTNGGTAGGSRRDDLHLAVMDAIPTPTPAPSPPLSRAASDASLPSAFGGAASHGDMCSGTPTHGAAIRWSSSVWVLDENGQLVYDAAAARALRSETAKRASMHVSSSMAFKSSAAMTGSIDEDDPAWDVDEGLNNLIPADPSAVYRHHNSHASQHPASRNSYRSPNNSHSYGHQSTSPPDSPTVEPVRWTPHHSAPAH